MVVKIRGVNELILYPFRLVVQPIMGLYLSLPFTIHIPPFNWAWNQFLEIRETFWAFLDEHIDVIILIIMNILL